MSNKTRAAIGIEASRDDPTGGMGSLLGVSKVTPVVSDIYKSDPILKAEKEMLQSNVLQIEDDPFIQLNINTLGEANQIIEPTYHPINLTSLAHSNNTLLQAVAAMEVNIDGTGFEIQRRDGKELGDADEAPVTKLEDFFNEPFPGESFVTIRRKLRRDLEATGNGFLEVIRNKAGEIVFLRHMEAKMTRLLRLDQPLPHVRKVKRGGKEFNAKVLERQRRYVQVVGRSMVRYFKDYGVERKLDASNGKWQGTPEELAALETSQPKAAGKQAPTIDNFTGTILPGNEATEVIHLTAIPDVLTPYGVPRWINNLPSVLGSRKAEEFNLEFFDHGGLPPAMIMIMGGQLDAKSRDSLTGYLAGKASIKQRGIVTEIFAASGDLGSAGNVKVAVERFGDERQKDSMFQIYDERCAEHVRIAFRLPPMFLGLSEAYNFACYDEQTETLTDQGWISASNFKEGMKVAQVDPDTGELEYVYPSALSTYSVDDVQMHTFKSQTTDICVTPKHRMLWRDTRKGDWRVTPVEDLNSRCQFKTTVDWKGGERLNIFEFPKPELSKYSSAKPQPLAIEATDFLQLVGWVVSDGHVAPDTYVGITQHKNRYWDEICALADRLPVRNTYVLNEDKEISQMCLADITLHRWAKENIGKGVDKCLPDWMLNLPKDQLEILFDTMMKGDGTINDKGTSYCTTSPKLRDQVQEIALKLGYRAKAIESASGTYGNLPVFRILLTKRDSTDIYPQNVSRKSYTGDVHCFTVPSGVYVTRRNGCVAIQGNTAYTAYMIAEAQVFRPERDEFDEAINLLLMKELGDATYVYRSKALNVVDVEQKLKGLELSSPFMNPTSFIDAMNEIVRTDFVPKDGIDDEVFESEVANEVNRFVGASERRQTNREEITGDGPAQTKSGSTKAGNKTSGGGRVLKVDFDDAIRELADDWAEHLSGGLDFQDENVQTMSKLINHLQPPIRKLFDGYVGMRLSSGGFDDDGVAELMACVGHRHETKE
jgi:PBSX family phage portal protein